MATIRQRNDPVRLFARRLGIGALLFLIAVAAGGVWNAYQKERESYTLRMQAEGQLSDLQEREGKLTTDIANLQTDRGMEEVLREQYALAAQGERLIVIVESPQSAPAHSTSTFLEKIKKAILWW